MTVSRLTKFTGVFFGRLYTFYRRQVLDKVEHIRGAYAVSRTLSSLSQIGLEKIGSEPEGIFEKEWDHLIILDACRYDYYSDMFEEADYRISRASATPEYIMENFQEGNFQDIIYISANPQFSEQKFRDYAGKEIDEAFFMMYDLFNSEWNEELSTVHPKDVVKHAKSAEKLYPEKRKIIHFMQPHAPYLVEREGELKSVDGAAAVYNGEKTVEEFRENYRECLEYVCSYIEELGDILEGRTVVTADHGELLGENRMLAMQHPFYLDTKSLRKVPWHIITE